MNKQKTNDDDCDESRAYFAPAERQMWQVLGFKGGKILIMVIIVPSFLLTFLYLDSR